MSAPLVAPREHPLTIVEAEARGLVPTDVPPPALLRVFGWAESSDPQFWEPPTQCPFFAAVRRIEGRGHE